MSFGARLGFRMLKKQKRKTFFSTMCIALGISLVFFLSLTSDAIEQRYSTVVQYQFGSVDFTLFDASSIDPHHQYVATWMPVNLSNDIASENGIKSVTWRAGGYWNWYYDNGIEVNTQTSVYGIPVANPDESDIGSAIVIDCLASIGDPSDVSFNDLLDTSLVSNPIVISNEISIQLGLSVLDEIQIPAENLTKLYATPTELQMVLNGSITMEDLEDSISQNVSRLVNFTVTGVIHDGSEATEQPLPPSSSSIDTLFPNIFTLYIRLNDSWEYVYNEHQDQCTFFMIDTTTGFSLESFRSSISSSLGTNVIVQDISSAFMQYSNFIMWLVRIALLLISALVVSLGATLIQSNIKTNIKTVFKDIGILKSNGYKKNALVHFMLAQVIPTSLIGTGLAYIIGFIPTLFFNPKQVVPMLVMGMNYPVEVDTPLIVSWQSILLTACVGMILPLLFSHFGIKKSKKLEAIELLKPEIIVSRSRLPDKKRMVIFRYILAGVLIVLLFISSSFIFSNHVNHVDFSNVGTVIAVPVFVLSFFLGSTIISIIVANSIKHIVSLFNRVSKKRIRTISKRMARANVKSIKTVAKNMVIASMFISFLTSVIHSIYIGQMKDARTTVGGDIIVFNPLLSVNNISSIETVEGVERATIIGYANMDSWRTNKALSSYGVNKLDWYGGDYHGATRDTLNVIIIDTESYLGVNNNPDTRIIHDGLESNAQFINSLNQVGTVIIQERLADDLGKKRGDTATLNVMGINSGVIVSGIANIVPGAPFMYEYGSSRSLVISRDTFKNMIDKFTGNCDVLIKNVSVDPSEFTNETVPDEYIGYSSGSISKSAIISLLSGVTGINDVSCRFSTFAPFAPRLYMDTNLSRYIYKDDDFVNYTSIDLPNRVYVFDSTDELEMSSNSRVLECHQFLNDNQFTIPEHSIGFGYHNESATEIMYGFDNLFAWTGGGGTQSSTLFGDNSICVVSKRVVMFNETINQVYVHEMEVGDNITVDFPVDNSTVPFNFTVVATVDNNIAYTYQDGEKQAGFLLSGKTLNYNSDTVMDDNSSFFNIFDVDGNVFLTTYKQIEHVAYITAGLPFGYDLDRIMNHVYIDVDDNLDIDSVVNDIKIAINASGNNYSVIPYKKMLMDTLVNKGALAVKIDGSVEKEDVVNNLRSWFVSQGIEWDVGSVVTIEDWVDLGAIKDIMQIFSVLMVFAMIIALLGLSQTIYEVFQERQREYGTIRCIGYKRKEVYDLIFKECLGITLSCAIIGMVIGMLLGQILFSGLSVPLQVSAYYEVDITTNIIIAISMVGISILSSLVIARKISKKEPIETLATINT